MAGLPLLRSVLRDPGPAAHPTDQRATPFGIVVALDIDESDKACVAQWSSSHHKPVMLDAPIPDGLVHVCLFLDDAEDDSGHGA